MSKEFRSLQNQITELKSRLIKIEAETKELRREANSKSKIEVNSQVTKTNEVKTNEETQYRELIEEYKKAENRIADNHFYQVALNLSGKREELEQKAGELIDGLGYIEALKQTRKTKSEVAKAEEKVIKNFLKWAIYNDYIEFDHLLSIPEDVNVTMDIAEKLIKEYLGNNR